MTHDEVEQFIEENRLAIIGEALTEYAKRHEANDDDVWTFFAKDERMIDLNVHRPEDSNHISVWGYRLNEDEVAGNTVDTSVDHFVGCLLLKEV
jgi:hypothetical protein